MVHAKVTEALKHAKTESEKKRALKMVNDVVSRPFAEVPAARMLYGVPVNANQRRQENVEMALM